MSVFDLSQADSPLVISVPHDGALIPAEVLATMHAYVPESSDRDLLISEVFNFPDLAYSKIVARYSRHLIDLNRPASGELLYNNQAETELCPSSTFDFKPIYLTGNEPDQQEIKRRVEAYWQPYHQQLMALIDKAKQRFGFCLLIDAHSIDDQVPRFFSGKLPDINVGTFSGQSCSAELADRLSTLLEAQSSFSHVINGRFKGGFITRQYGRPDDHVYAIQLEHAKSAYLDQQSSISSKGADLRKFWRQTLADLLSVHKS